MLYFAIYLILLLFTSPLSGQESPYDLERGLNLNSEQKIKIEQIKRKYIEEDSNIRDEILQKRLELFREMKKPNPDSERIRLLKREIEELSIKRAFIFEKYRDDLRAVLTPEQKRMYDDFCRKEKKRMRKHLLR